MELLIFLGTLFLFMCLGIPLALVLVICAMVLMFHSGMWDTMIIPTSMLDGANNYPLMAIPFFVFAGEIMAAGGLSKRVVALAQLMPSWPPSSLLASWAPPWARLQPLAACFCP